MTHDEPKGTHAPAPGEIAALARSDPRALSERLAALTLAAQRELALALPPKERLEVLLHAPAPMRLVRSLPDAEVYLTVREVGPHDALPLLALSSREQIAHLMDLETWRGDRFDAKRAGAWAALLLEAGEATLVRFLRHADDEVLMLLFRKWAGLEAIESPEDPSIHGHGETEAGTEQGFISPDGAYRFSPAIPEHGPALRRLAEIFFQQDPGRYGQILWGSLNELPVELEEEALRWRQSRLEEHGFAPRDEALTVYAPPEGPRRRAEPVPRLGAEREPAPRALVRTLGGRGILPAALELLEGEEREAAFHAVTSLANRILVADAADTGDTEAHRAALGRASAYVGIALSARGASDPHAGAAALREVPVLELFREGYARVAELKRRANGLAGTGWASLHPRALELLDAPIRPRVQGLLLTRPLYYDTTLSTGGTPFRDFFSLEEIEETRVALDLAETLGKIVVERLGLDVGAFLDRAGGPAGEAARFSTLLLTTLAWHAVRGELRGEPLPPGVAAEFLRRHVSARTAEAGALQRALDALLASLARQASLDRLRLAELSAFATACLDRLAEECGALDPDAAVDARSVSCLILSG